MFIPQGYSQVNVIMGGAGLPNGAQWTFGVRNNLETDPTSIANAIAAQISASTLMTNFTNAVTINSIRVKNGPGEDGPFSEVAAVIPGTVSGSVVPPNTSLLVKKVTGQGGRRGQGRMFLPGLDESEVDGTGTVGSSRRTAVGTDLNALLLSLSGADLDMVVLHGDPGFAPLDVTALVVQTKVATQRRRLRR